jgi:hypothetical protein
LTIRRLDRTLATVRVGWAAVVACSLLLVGCTSSSLAARTSTSVPAVSTSTAPTTTTTAPRPTPTTAPERFVVPRVFAAATFVETRGTLVAIARVDDGKIVQVLTPAPPPPGRFIPEAMRAPNGGLIVKFVGNGGDAWRDTANGAVFAGERGHISPDGQRFAAVVYEPNRQNVVRQYDLASGRVLSDLNVGQPDTDLELGFAWTPDSRALVVAMAGGTAPGAVYVVDRDAHELPGRAAATAKLGQAFIGPAMLANGHVAAFECPWPVQRPAWPTTLVDINLRTGTRRTVLGADLTSAHPLFLNFDSPVEARGADALFTDGDHITWLYDGRTARRMASGNDASHW